MPTSVSNADALVDSVPCTLFINDDINDAAERGVKLIEEYNNILPKKEEEKQYLLQVVTDYRKNFKSHTKTALTSTTS